MHRGAHPDRPARAGDRRGPGHLRHADVQPERHRVVPEGDGLLRGGPAHRHVPDRLRGRGRAALAGATTSPRARRRRRCPAARSPGSERPRPRSSPAPRRRGRPRRSRGSSCRSSRSAPISGASPRTRGPACACPGSSSPTRPSWRPSGSDAALEQVANGATLPGIVKASLAMPDIHQGYGLPVGGVVATDAEHGVVSPGGDRLRHQLRRAPAADRPRGRRRARPRMERAGRRARPGDPDRRRVTGPVALSARELRRGPARGAPGGRWREGYGEGEDLDRIESHGRLPGADPRRRVGARRYERGRTPARHARLGQPLPRGAGRRDRAPTRRRGERSGSTRAGSR